MPPTPRGDYDSDADATPPPASFALSYASGGNPAVETLDPVGNRFVVNMLGETRVFKGEENPLLMAGVAGAGAAGAGVDGGGVGCDGSEIIDVEEESGGQMAETVATDGRGRPEGSMMTALVKCWSRALRLSRPTRKHLACFVLFFVLFFFVFVFVFVLFYK